LFVVNIERKMNECFAEYAAQNNNFDIFSFFDFEIVLTSKCNELLFGFCHIHIIEKQNKNKTTNKSKSSFLDIGEYKSILDRKEDGLTSLNLVMKMVKERSEIESEYARKLARWSENYNKGFLVSDCEYNLSKKVIVDGLEEAKSIAQIHQNISDSLLSKAHTKLKAFTTKNYTKSLNPIKKISKLTLKETINNDKEFKNIQKQWINLDNKQKDLKIKFLASTQERRDADSALKSARETLKLLIYSGGVHGPFGSSSKGISGISVFRKPSSAIKFTKNRAANAVQKNSARIPSKEETDNKVKSMNEKIDKYSANLSICENNENKLRQEYQKAVEECHKLIPTYRLEMSKIYAKLQDEEFKRLVFLQGILNDICYDLDISKNLKISHVYNKQREYLAILDPENDVKWWDKHRGMSAVEMVWPKFEDRFSKHAMHSSRSSSQNICIKSTPPTSTREVNICYANSPNRIENAGSDYNQIDIKTRGRALQKQMQRVPSFEGLPFKAPSLSRLDQNPKNQASACTVDVNLVPVNHINQVSEGETQSDSQSMLPLDKNPIQVTEILANMQMNRNEEFQEAETNSEPGPSASISQVRGPPKHTPPPYVPESIHIPSSGSGPIARALYDFDHKEDDEISIKVGDEFVLIDDGSIPEGSGWSKGVNRVTGECGLFPTDYVQVISD